MMTGPVALVKSLLAQIKTLKGVAKDLDKIGGHKQILTCILIDVFCVELALSQLACTFGYDKREKEEMESEYAFLFGMLDLEETGSSVALEKIHVAAKYFLELVLDHMVNDRLKITTPLNWVGESLKSHKDLSKVWELFCQVNAKYVSMFFHEFTMIFGSQMGKGKLHG